MSELRRVDDVTWEVPAEARADMRVPARVFADAELVEAIGDEGWLEQLCNVATLPGIVEAALAMPDVHQGYGFPVGGVAATAPPDGVVSPGGVGYDINCGVRLLALPLAEELGGKRRERLVHELSRAVPAGAGREGGLDLRGASLEQVLAEGAQALVRRGLGVPEDVERTESGGRMPGADPAEVSERARQRGGGQIGTLGSGNHFVELQRVDRVLDRAAAAAYGLDEGGLTVLIHSGSRGLGHQVCTDFVRRMDVALARHGITLPDRQLSCAPIGSDDGRAFPPGSPDVPEAYREAGQPVFIPGSMGTSSFVLAGRPGAMERSFGTVCHGAGRALSRTAARRRISGAELRRELEARGIVVRSASNRGLAEEAPFAYKDVERVVRVVERAGLAAPVAQLRPLGVVKG